MCSELDGDNCRAQQRGDRNITKQDLTIYKKKDTLLRHMILVCNGSSTLEPCALQTKKYSAHT
jgi:hypothetical protein